MVEEPFLFTFFVQDMEARHAIGFFFNNFMIIAIALNVFMAIIQTIKDLRVKYLEYRYNNAMQKIEEEKDRIIK